MHGSSIYLDCTTHIVCTVCTIHVVCCTIHVVCCTTITNCNSKQKIVMHVRTQLMILTSRDIACDRTAIINIFPQITAGHWRADLLKLCERTAGYWRADLLKLCERKHFMIAYVFQSMPKCKCEYIISTTIHSSVPSAARVQSR